MPVSILSKIESASLKNDLLDENEYRLIFDPSTPLLQVLASAYTVRAASFGNKVQVHIINNIQNGLCPENCKYCAQAMDSEAPIEKYRMKSEPEILAEAKRAYESGAFRYCMVASGRGPSDKQIDFYSSVIQKIKAQYPIQVCLSSGLMNQSATSKLKAAGLDRLNHNLNTSAENYSEICSTHTFQDRLNTLQAGSDAGIELCSGVIVGLGESVADLIALAIKLRSLGVVSIPVNFYLPIEGNQLKPDSSMTPEKCLRILSLFRFINPTAEIRVAAGREYHFRALQPLAFYPANSLFLDGYLNVKGSDAAATYQMLKDAGFEIDSEFSIDQFSEPANGSDQSVGYNLEIKSQNELRPARA